MIRVVTRIHIRLRHGTFTRIMYVLINFVPDHPRRDSEILTVTKNIRNER